MEVYILCALVLLIILLFVTGLGKVVNHSTFVSQLNKQPLPNWSTPILSYLLPMLELGAVAFMCIPKLRLWGLGFGTVLMTAYTIYAYLAYIEIYGYIPCACGKVFEKMSWKQHFFFNLAITLLGVPALIMEYKLKNRNKKLCIANSDESSASRKGSQ
ncbi:MauE/DoxX family redox-associated membrane protein [Sphingobacterium sp. GVS05A]|uniref:MauE/DoxX family redox-associated membrane protein n=1 Tax=Sphingobacterium sp. GVS05A TaxID=2862679 RepID=UPI001CBE1EA7|nr:MauE/DoxX family redox-associated membrane protein [Sphingobacterium sp. GVS05A]